MWMAVDRIEGEYVILIDDSGKAHELPLQAYLQTVGQPPVETHVLHCTMIDGVIASATYDPQETQRRLDAARARLERLKQRSKP